MNDFNADTVGRINDLMETSEEFRRIARTGSVAYTLAANYLRLHETTGDRRWATMARATTDDLEVIRARFNELAKVLNDADLLEDVFGAWIESRKEGGP
jgi:hypothetical protein